MLNRAEFTSNSAIGSSKNPSHGPLSILSPPCETRKKQNARANQQNNPGNVRAENVNAVAVDTGCGSSARLLLRKQCLILRLRQTTRVRVLAGLRHADLRRRKDVVNRLDATRNQFRQC